ncbi:MAG: glycosyltransferase [Oculatellaceae cyanobacterium bins.114]|nr:glycosyltransferase [Oculatellaceae cyanobacterium bins.114]
MKVLHVIPSISPALGGPTYVVLNLVKALRECGVDAEIATTNDDGFNFLDVPFNQRVDYTTETPEKITVPVWFSPRFSPPLKEFIFSPVMTQWLWQRIQNYSVVDNHYLFSYAPTCAAAIAQHYNIPYTVRTMGQLTPWALAQSRLKKQIYTLLIERRNLNRAAAIHCTAIDEAKDVRRFGIKAPTVTLPLGVHLPVLQPNAKQKLHQRYGIPSNRSIVLFLSRLHYKKRPEVLLRSLRQLIAQNQDVHLILAGSGEAEYVDSLMHLMSSLGIAAHTTFVGFVTGSEKDLLLQGSDLFALPSFSENFGVAIAEAMAAQLPVVITPGIQIATDVANAKAGLVVEGEVEAFTQAIAQLLDSATLREQLGQNGRTFASYNYSWKSIALHLAEVYTLIIENQRLPHDIVF